MGDMVGYGDLALPLRDIGSIMGDVIGGGICAGQHGNGAQQYFAMTQGDDP